MLNNDLPYDPKLIQKKCEDRWSKLIGIDKKDQKLKSMFMKACEALKERIIKDELERGNKDALANLVRKYQNTE